MSGVRATSSTCRRTAAAIARAAPHIDIFGAGATSWFMANDLQARLFRLGLSSTLGPTTHLQQVAGGAQRPGAGGDRDLARGRHALAAGRGGHRARAGREGRRAHRPGTLLAARADLLLALKWPDDAVMHVGIDAYLAHLTVIEILTVLVAQRLGEPAVERLRACARLQRTASICTPTPLRLGRRASWPTNEHA